MEQQRKWVFDLNEANTAAVEPPHGYFAGSDRLAEQISASSSSSAATTSSSSSSSGNASTSELKLKVCVWACMHVCAFRYNVLDVRVLSVRVHVVCGQSVL